MWLGAKLRSFLGARPAVALRLNPAAAAIDGSVPQLVCGRLSPPLQICG